MNMPVDKVFSLLQRHTVDTTKEKCRKFLANLLELSSREPKSVERNVRTLIQELIDAKVEPEEFCDRLERLLNASPQPCLIGFLKVLEFLQLSSVSYREQLGTNNKNFISLIFLLLVLLNLLLIKDISL
jgi:uncharacterized membrane protein